MKDQASRVGDIYHLKLPDGRHAYAQYVAFSPKVGKAQATIYIYGEDAEMIFVQIRPRVEALQANRNCKVLIRRGGPRIPEKTIKLDSLASLPA